MTDQPSNVARGTSRRIANPKPLARYSAAGRRARRRRRMMDEQRDAAAPNVVDNASSWVDDGA